MTGKIYKVTHETTGRRNPWCGPAALSAVTGYTAESMVRMIQDRRGRRRDGRRLGVKGVYNGEMVDTLRRLGFVVKEGLAGKMTENGHRPTLARWLRQRDPETRKRTCIVSVTGHYVVVRGNTFIDNNTQDGCTISKAPRRRARVGHWFEIVEAPRKKRRCV